MTKQKKLKKHALSQIISGVLATSTFIYSGMSLAEEPNAEEIKDNKAGLETITVTARKRIENIQDVPDSVVSISADTIERANINSARDVTTRIPNVSIMESLSPTSTFIIVRGISSVRNSEPAVAVIVDGVQVGSASEISQSYFDVEQIELLKGPQGALYGRNALGGALIITSKKPTDAIEGKVQMTRGGDGLFQVAGSITGPIADNLYIRAAASHKSFDGTIENEYLTRVLERNSRAVTGDSPSSSNMDFEENNDYRVQLMWAPSDNLNMDYRYAHNGLETGAMWYRNIYRLESDPSKTYEFPINSNGNPTAFRDIDTHSLKFEYELDSGTLSGVSSYTDTNERYGVAGEVRGNDRTGNVLFFTEPFVNEFIDGLTNPIDQDFFKKELANWAAGNFVGSDQYYDIQTLSQEVRFASLGEGDFRYEAGAYMLLTDRADTIRSTWETPSGSAFDCEPKVPGGPIITDFSTCNGLIDATQNVQDNSAWALFVSTDYDITDRLTLTSALRYDSDTREVTRIDGPTVDTFGKGVGSCDSVSDSENCNPTGSKIKDTFSAFQPKMSLAYKLDDITYYGTYARGFRSGGFNASGALLTDSYDKETLDSFELGFKATLLDGRMRASAAVFQQDYKNAQQFEFDGNVFVQSLYNIPESEISGIEASVEFAVTENLTLNTAFGIMDSEIIEFDQSILGKMRSELNSRISNTVKLPQGTSEAFDKGFKGEHLPNFAHKTANISLVHELPLSNNRYLTTSIDYSIFGDRYWWIDGQDKQENVGLFNASTGFEFSENWEVRAWCKNCLNEIYDSEFAPTEKELFGGAGKDIAYRARGRTFGIKMTYSFD